LRVISRNRDNAMSISRYTSLYYDYAPFKAYVKLSADRAMAKSPLRKLALHYRRQDYLGLAGKPALFLLHQKLHAALLDGETNWKSYDYGEGYFYQSLKHIGIH